MNIVEYLNSKNYNFKIKGDEAYLSECPFCHDKNSHWRFLVNIKTGAYICNRQDNCGAKGYIKLPKEKEIIENKAIQNLSSSLDLVSGSLLKYMTEERKISLNTLKKARVFSRNNNFCFFYTNLEGKAIGIKYRSIDKKIFCEKGSEMTLINWDRVDPEIYSTLYVTEGEMDMLSLMEVGFENVVSIPNGASSMEWIDKQIDFLKKFDTLIFIMDNDGAGKKALKTINERLSSFQMKLKTIDLLFYKDPNEILQDDDGKIKLKNIIENNIKDLVIPKVYIVSKVKIENEVEEVDWKDRGLNHMIGGMQYGRLMLLSGNSGCGKSTFANNLMANLLDQGLKVYTHQGESSPSSFKTNLYKIFCRSDSIQKYYDNFKEKYYGKVTEEIEEKIDAWLGDKLIVHGSLTPTKNELLNTMEFMYKNNGIRIFFIDNLMTIDLPTENKYDEQKSLFLDLQTFVKKYNVFVLIIAHPKKNSIANLDSVDQYIISGSSDMINSSDVAIYLKRLSEKEKDVLKSNIRRDASTGGINLKDRFHGDVGMKTFWNFDDKNCRFLYVHEQEEIKKRKYCWEDFNTPRINLSLPDLI